MEVSVPERTAEVMGIEMRHELDSPESIAELPASMVHNIRKA
jgi:hypothetical protein